jgi:molecular chaperone DnaK (HSP70)
MKVKAVTYDTQLGGRDFDYRLAEHLAGVAVKQMAAKGIKSSVDEIKANKKAWARLITAASQAKTVLSANMETYAAVRALSLWTERSTCSSPSSSR